MTTAMLNARMILKGGPRAYCVCVISSFSYCFIEEDLCCCSCQQLALCWCLRSGKLKLARHLATWHGYEEEWKSNFPLLLSPFPFPSISHLFLEKEASCLVKLNRLPITDVRSVVVIVVTNVCYASWLSQFAVGSGRCLGDFTHFSPTKWSRRNSAQGLIHWHVLVARIEATAEAGAAAKAEAEEKKQLLLLCVFLCVFKLPHLNSSLLFSHRLVLIRLKLTWREKGGA